MAKVVSVGEPVNESERLAIDFLRDHLPKRWRIFHNFMIQRDGTLFEVDIAILAPNVVYLVDIKRKRVVPRNRPLRCVNYASTLEQ